MALQTTASTNPRRSFGTLTELLRQFGSYGLVLVVGFWLVRIVELVGLGQPPSYGADELLFIFRGFLNDLIVALQAFTVILPVILFLAVWTNRGAVWAARSLTAIVLVADASLSRYFMTSRVLLGADLFGYSLQDIRTTVVSSGALSLATLTPFLLLAAFLFAVHRYQHKRLLPRTAAMVIVFISVGAWVLALAGPEQSSDVQQYQISVNKTDHFIRTVIKHWYDTRQAVNREGASGYPFYRDFSYQDVLGPYFTKQASMPNLVFILVEGLGRDFVGPRARYGGFTPFLDSLAGQSLFWENFLSNAGRTFGVLPSMFGSLPFGRNGFMDYADAMPSHESLIRILNSHGYTASFYYGGNANFDYQDLFLEGEKIDYILDENKFGASYARMAGDQAGFSWGYPDGDLFRKSLEIIDAKHAQPRLDIYLTLSLHEPFIPPSNQEYLDRTNRLLAVSVRSEEYNRTVRESRNVFATLLYVDDMIRRFLDAYRRRPDFANTIFIITGDHRLVPIPQQTPFDRYRVPLIIYSPLLKKPVSFASVSSHRDITPTLLAFLGNGYGIKLEQKAHWLGNGIDTAREFRNIHTIPFMRSKGDQSDFLTHDVLLSGDRVFRIEPDLSLVPEANETLLQESKRELADFQARSLYACEHNALMPGTTSDLTARKASATADSLWNSTGALQLSPDQQFYLARSLAFSGDYARARVVCEHLLLTSPNYHDVRMLLGRTYAWDGQRNTARRHFEEVQHRAPDYYDSYCAMIDLHIWDGELDSAQLLMKRALKMFPANEEVLLKEAQLLRRTGDKDMARKVVNKILHINSKNTEAAALKRTLQP